MQTLTNDSSLPKWQRLSQGLQALSGLELTGISEEVRGPFEAELVGVNRVMEQYPVEKEEDYRIISAVDLQQVLETLDTAASRAIAAELDRIAADLDAGVEKLPVEAIREAREHRDLMVPRLIEVLKDATSGAWAGEVPKGNAHFFAIFLLTEFHAEAAFPAILKAFSLPGELPFDLFGDAVTSTLSRILARFAGPELMDALIEDPALNQYVRWEAAQSYVYLVRDGRLGRDEAVERLRQLLRRAIDKSDKAVIGAIICVLVSFAPAEALDDIEEAFGRGLVDSMLVGLESVNRSIAEGEARVRKELELCPATGIEDAIEVLRHWAFFKEEPAQPRAPLPPSPHVPTAPELDEPPPTAPVLSRSRRVGRNEPCPCGSGKKFKKCCGSRK